MPPGAAVRRGSLSRRTDRHLNAAPAVIAGVLPQSFVFPADSARTRPDILVPFAQAQRLILALDDDRTAGQSHDADRDGPAELDTIAAGRGADSGLRNAVIDGATVEPSTSRLAEGSRTILLLLVGGVAALLLIGCVNVANLLRARHTRARHRSPGRDSRCDERLARATARSSGCY